jgi:DNA-binding XRE family transcriptional regulator
VNTNSEMAAKLSDPEYRSSFVESQINMGLPFKIKALRKQRNWTQPQLAERAGMKQSRISAIEKPGGGIQCVGSQDDIWAVENWPER